MFLVGLGWSMGALTTLLLVLLGQNTSQIYVSACQNSNMGLFSCPLPKKSSGYVYSDIVSHYHNKLNVGNVLGTEFGNEGQSIFESQESNGHGHGKHILYTKFSVLRAFFLAGDVFLLCVHCIFDCWIWWYFCKQHIWEGINFLCLSRFTAQSSNFKNDCFLVSTLGSKPSSCSGIWIISKSPSLLSDYCTFYVLLNYPIDVMIMHTMTKMKCSKTLSTHWRIFKLWCPVSW